MGAVYQTKIRNGGKVRTLVLQAESEEDARRRFSKILRSEQGDGSPQIGMDLLDVQLFNEGELWQK